MKLKVDSEDKYPRVYWPPELKEAGFLGDLTVITGPYVAVVTHPGANVEQVKQNLEVILKDLKLRLAPPPAGSMTVKALGEEVPKGPEVSVPALIYCPYQDCRGPMSWPPDLAQGLCPHCGRGVQVVRHG